MNVMPDGLRFFFTTVKYFDKYGCRDPMKDKTAKNVLGVFKKCITTHNIQTTLHTDNGTEFKKNSIKNQFWLERNIQHIFGTPYNPQHQRDVEAFNRTVQNFLKLVKDHQKWLNLDCSICDFQLHSNDWFHLTTKVAQYKAMMDASDKELMKIKEKHLKRRLKEKTVSETYPDDSYIIVSNYIKIIGKEHVCFHLPKRLQKSFIKKNR